MPDDTALIAKQSEDASLKLTSEQIYDLLAKGLESYNLSASNQHFEIEARMEKDKQDHEFRKQALEVEKERFNRLIENDWTKFNRVFWLSAAVIMIILAVSAGLIFIAKDVDKGLSLISYTVIGILALLAGRGLWRQPPQPKP